MAAVAFDMNHKRGRPKNRRAGCLLCKPNKANGLKHRLEVGHAGFGKIRRELRARADLNEAMRQGSHGKPQSMRTPGLPSAAAAWL